nr:MAG TPA: BRO family protein [Caudoviricetes sp.]
MNAQISLSFRDVNFDITDIHGQPWLRSFQIGSALGYKNPSSDMAKLYDRNADEFTDSMTQVIELPTAGGKQQVRVFSLRGCHLLGMLARTKVAKEFRRWVLDVLEKEVSGSLQPKLAKTTVADRTPLRQAVSALVGRCGFDYSAAYHLVHQRFGVGSIEEIAAEDLPEAVEYVHMLTVYGGMCGEVLEKQPAPSAPVLDDALLLAFARLLLHAQDMRLFVNRYLPAFQNLGIDGRGALWSFVHDTEPTFAAARRFMTAQSVQSGFFARDWDWVRSRILSTAQAL